MYEDKPCAMFMCPVTDLEMNGKFHFLLDFTSDKDDAPGTSYDKQEINPKMIEPAKLAKHHIPRNTSWTTPRTPTTPSPAREAATW